MPKKLHIDFTPEVCAKLRAHVDKWVAKAFSTTPVDPVRITDAINPKEAPRGYVAKPCACGCLGCVFLRATGCRNLNAKCQGFDRKDGREVIFRKATKKKTKKRA